MVDIVKKSKVLTSTLLSEDELEAVKAEARETVLKDQKKEARKKALEDAIKAERRALDPEESVEELMIDIPGYAREILIDGAKYFHGVVYKLTKKQASSIKDIMCCAWRHENTMNSVNRNQYVAPRNTMLSPAGHYNRLGA